MDVRVNLLISIDPQISLAARSLKKDSNYMNFSTFVSLSQLETGRDVRVLNNLEIVEESGKVCYNYEFVLKGCHVTNLTTPVLDSLSYINYG